VRKGTCGDHVASQTLRVWRESKGWDVRHLVRELRKAARDTGEDMAAHHRLVKMITQRDEATAPRVARLAPPTQIRVLGVAALRKRGANSRNWHPGS
jgi:hypothetical protein